MAYASQKIRIRTTTVSRVGPLHIIEVKTKIKRNLVIKCKLCLLELQIKMLFGIIIQVVELFLFI